ncbi:hypothetical protein D3227_35110 [Mesorhizobium waimense]|uniref:Uncharacterized protein n=1 Tax=Mesorhizobium waimense TaxID=1300307 RepID=A0A3A5K0B4_9HYPH|nr:hypothetical protein [Mesorhizobium waimense]RJT28127.1 hypothetical protein D3227_35110 [Mesorhizobium waimense]
MSEIDRATLLAGLAAIAAEVERLAGLIADEPGPVATSADTFDAEGLVDSAIAAQRFGISKQVVRRLCREFPDIGHKVVGRHRVSLSALRRHLRA